MYFNLLIRWLWNPLRSRWCGSAQRDTRRHNWLGSNNRANSDTEINWLLYTVFLRKINSLHTRPRFTICRLPYYSRRKRNTNGSCSQNPNMCFKPLFVFSKWNIKRNRLAGIITATRTRHVRLLYVQSQSFAHKLWILNTVISVRTRVQSYHCYCCGRQQLASRRAGDFEGNEAHYIMA